MTLGRIAGDSAWGKCSEVFWKAGKILRWNENKGRHQEGYRGESSDDLGRDAPGAMLLGRAWGLCSRGARGTVLREMLGGGFLGDAGEGAGV